MRPGTSATGNGNVDADPEVLVCSRGLKSFGLADPLQDRLQCAISQTTLFPDGDTFTGVASSSENDIVVYTYFNESVGVIGTPQIELKDGTNLDSSFGAYGSTNLDYKSSLSNFRCWYCGIWT